MNVRGLLGSRGEGTGDAPHHRRSVRLLLALGGALLSVLGVASARTATFRSTQFVVEATRVAVVPAGAAARLAGALRIATISHEDPGAFDDEGLRVLERAILAITPGAIVAPHQVVVTTDARYFAGLGEFVLRFVPLRLTSRDLARMHGTDERVAIRDYEEAIRFYRHLFSNSAST